jgi:hypothetical protein
MFKREKWVFRIVIRANGLSDLLQRILDYYVKVSGVHLNLSSKLPLKSRLWTHRGLQITDQLFKSNLTFCVFTGKTDEWCLHRLFNANFEDKFKLTPIYWYVLWEVGTHGDFEFGAVVRSKRQTQNT